MSPVFLLRSLNFVTQNRGVDSLQTWAGDALNIGTVPTNVKWRSLSYGAAGACGRTLDTNQVQCFGAPGTYMVNTDNNCIPRSLVTYVCSSNSHGNSIRMSTIGLISIWHILLAVVFVAMVLYYVSDIHMISNIRLIMMVLHGCIMKLILQQAHDLVNCICPCLWDVVHY
jgi:hypothetical protein